MKRSKHDMLLIQETKWRFESSWEDDTHYFIHSGTSAKDHKQAGILTIISKRIVDPGSFRFISAIEGRLQRIQFKHGPRQVDVINFYQHTWRPTAHVQALRHKAWDALTHQIQAVPLRSRLIVGGDFNTPCTTTAPHSGPGVLRKTDQGIQDADEFAAIIQGLDLVVLNTYQQSVPAHTYHWNQQKSQIDFWLTRRLHAGGKAKAATPLPELHVGRWRGGPRHLPVQAWVMYHWQPWEHKRFQAATSSTEVDRMDIIQALHNEKDNRITQFRMDVQALIESGASSIEALQPQIFSLACKYFPKRPPAKLAKPWQDGTLTHYAETMWSHFRARAALIRRVRGRPSLAAAFKIWKHTMYFNKMHTAARERGKLLRKQRTLDLLQAARKAALDHDFREHHRLIQLLAPKATYRKFQLRLGGQLLTPEAEMQEMTKHFSNLYKSQEARHHTRATIADDVTVTPEEITDAIRDLNASKAGLPGSSPGAVWRLCGDQVAPLIAADLSHRWRCGQAHIPNLWSVAGLALILKPGKPGTLPAHYRPIGLIDALGKAAIAMLFRKIRHDLETYVLASPQFAYVRGRSTQEALRRVFYHCHQARTLRAQNSRNLHAKRAGFRSTPLTGGIQVCLDMSTAFDVMPRADLQEALWEAGVPESPARLLLHWIDSSVYRIRINHLTTDIRSSRGVKQGCPVSPLLFAAYSTMITRRIDARLQEPWTAQHATLYADDWHLSSLFHSRQQFDCICQRIGVVLAILSRHGMLVNAAKTAVILTTQGAQRRQVLGEFTRYLQEQRHLKVQVSGQAIYLPMVRQAEYLGAIISHNNSVPSHWNTASANARRPTAAFVKCSKDAGASPCVTVYFCGNPQSYLVLSMDLGLAVSTVNRSSDYTKSCSNSSEL